MNSFRPVGLIPVYNHCRRLSQVVDGLRQVGLAVIIVDDGSDDECARHIDTLAAQDSVTLHRLPENRGKGAAVTAGLETAQAMGFTHALQVDADGQHDLRDALSMLELAEKQPEKLISGRPVYDDSVPKARLYGRYVTHAWVWLETLSFALKDSMCGYRVYPVAASLAVVREKGVGQRMDFDTEIMVRLFWRGHESLFVPTKVIYPADGSSHFRLWADNWLITKMHTRLVFGMLRRLPRLITHRERPATANWSKISERGNRFGMRVLLFFSKYLGQQTARILLYPVCAYYLLAHRVARHASYDYLARVNVRVEPGLRELTKPVLRNALRHFVAFSATALEKFLAWKDPESLPPVDINGLDALNSLRQNGRGALLISAHLGNLEISRALAAMDPSLKINALVYTKNAHKFTRLLEEVNPQFRERLIVVDNVGPDTAIRLRELVDHGEIVVIVGDRTPASENGRSVSAQFLGAEAPFAIGPYLLAHILECPAGLLFCVRDHARYRIFIEHFAERIRLPRKNRDFILRAHAQQFADRLEYYALQYPLQWFNFFDFWKNENHCYPAYESEQEIADDAKSQYR